MLTSNKSVDELRDELLQIDDDLRRLGEQEREAERGIDSLALLAHRGDMQAEKKIGTYGRIARHCLEPPQEAASGSCQRRIRIANGAERCQPRNLERKGARGKKNC